MDNNKFKEYHKKVKEVYKKYKLYFKVKNTNLTLLKMMIITLKNLNINGFLDGYQRRTQKTIINKLLDLNKYNDLFLIKLDEACKFEYNKINDNKIDEFLLSDTSDEEYNDIEKYFILDDKADKVNNIIVSFNTFSDEIITS